MRKAIWLIVGVLLAFLFIPIPSGTYDDGGTREYTALTYKIVDWHRLSNDGAYDPCRIYFFPKNFLSIDELWELENVSVIDDPPEAGAVDFAAQYIRTDGYHEELSYPAVRLIRSVEELNTYYEANKDLYNLEHRDNPAADSTIGFLDACDRYDDAFFEAHLLILVLLEEGSGSTRHKVTAVRQNAEGALTVDIETIVPESGTCDMALWHIFVETTADIESEAAISLSFANEQPTKLIANYKQNYTNITLPIPDGWDYELTDNGIRFWPSGHADGKLHAQFSGAFGVCGTGLTCEDIMLGGYEAEQGTYDGKAVWDYIYLKNTVGDYVIMNEGADVWWDEYGDDAMDIFDRIVVGEGLLSEEKAIRLAKEACTIDYTDIHTSFDSQNGTWCITFGQGAWVDGGCQTVTLDAVTGDILDIVSGE